MNRICSKLQTKRKNSSMKKTASLILLLGILLTAMSASAQRTIKNVRFGSYSLNTSEENFIKKLEKAGWKTVDQTAGQNDQGRAVIKTTLQGKINGIDAFATVVPDPERETVGELILFTDSNPTLNPTRYEVLKSWLENTYGAPTVKDLKDEDGDISCYWGNFKGGERDLQKNNVCITTADGEVTVINLINRENALDATVNNIGDAVESLGDKMHRSGKKAVDKGREFKEKVKEKAEQIGDKISGKAEDAADVIAEESGEVWDTTKESAGKVSKKAKKIAKSAANGAKSAWRSVKNTFKRKDKTAEQ